MLSKLDLQTKIADIGLPFIDVILEEIFFIPPGTHLPEKPRPVTIYDLVKISARPEDLVLQKLREIQRLMGKSHPADENAVTRLLQSLRSPEAPLLLDVRMRMEDSYAPLPGSLHLPSMQTEAYKAALAKDHPCLTFSDDGRKAFSAALWLREQGYFQAFSTSTAAVRAALGLTAALVAIVSLFAPYSSAYAVDGEEFEAQRAVVSSSPQFDYSLQLFVQRPSIKINFSRNDPPERIENNEHFDGMRYEAESTNAVGLRASWRNIGAMITRRVGTMDHLTTWKFEDYQLSHYAGKFGLNLRYQRYSGMIQVMEYEVHRSEDDFGTPRTRGVYTSRPSASLAHSSVAARYLFWERDFSLSEAFGEVPVQMRRGYGFPLFIAASRTEFDAGGPLVDDRFRYFFDSTSNLRRIATNAGYIGGGAAGMLPFKRQFFVSGHASAGIGAQRVSAVREEDGAEHGRTIYDAAYKSDLCFVIGWNRERAFATLTYDLEGTAFRHSRVTATVQSDMIALASGLRF